MSERRYCTLCLTAYGTYNDLKTLSFRKNNKWVKSGLYQCQVCLVIGADNNTYKKLRVPGFRHDQIRKLDTVMEGGC